MMCKLLPIASSLSDDVHPRSSQHMAQFSNVITLDCTRKLHLPRLPEADASSESSPTAGVFICIWPAKVTLKGKCHAVRYTVVSDYQSWMASVKLSHLCKRDFSSLRRLPDSLACVCCFFSSCVVYNAFDSRCLHILLPTILPSILAPA